jgi:hypothetical protein
MLDTSNRKSTALKIAGIILGIVYVLLVAVFKGFENLPKGLNEVIFVWAAISVFLFLRHQNELKDKAYLYISLIIIAFMAFWRVFFLNISSRYSSGLILPFAIFASFFVFNGLSKRRRPLVRLALIAAIVGSSVVLFCMNFNGLTRNHYCDVVAEIFSGIDGTKENHVFAVEKENFFRIGVIGGLDRAGMEAIDDEIAFDEYLAGYTRVYPDTIVNILSKGPHAEPEKNGYKLTKIVSLCENPKKQKYRLLYAVVPDSANRCDLIPENEIVPQPSGLLENGDFEALDSPEESDAKLGLCLLAGAAPPEEGFRTPRNAYFFTPPPKKRKIDELLEVPWEWLAKIVQPKPKRPPECNVFTGSAIDGSNSARIQAPALPARLMFERRFPGGTYECSMLVRGSRGTEITVLRDECRNGERVIVPVATAILTDKRLYRITARFSVEGLAEGDSFQFGVEVAKGEADIDDVTLAEAAALP